MRRSLISALCFCIYVCVSAQPGFRTPAIGVYTGVGNYEGDLKPNSFTFNHSHPFVSFYFVQPVSGRINLRGGITTGKIEGADKYNRDYLKPRNLGFVTNIRDVYAGVEIMMLDPEKNRLVPYIFLGGAGFHFNPWTEDLAGNKVYLQPLSTEGQGLAEYPERKKYNLDNYALVYSGGLKFRLSENAVVGIELSERKTFTDYLDDVSSSYVDYDVLKTAKGQQAVDIAFRADELTAQNYPHAGDQRGTPTEKDWYYFAGVLLEVKLSAIKEKFTHGFAGKKQYYMKACPSVF